MINSIDNTNQQVKPAGFNFNRAGEGALFPKLSVFSNEKVNELLQSTASHETSPYDLYDDQTGKLNLDKEVWAQAFMQQQVAKFEDENTQEYIRHSVIDEGENRYEYDSNGDGNFETFVNFTNYGSNCIQIEDEQELDTNTIHIHNSSVGDNVEICSDNGSTLFETEGTSINPNNNIFRLNNAGNVFSVEYDDEGKVVNTEIIK